MYYFKLTYIIILSIIIIVLWYNNNTYLYNINNEIYSLQTTLTKRSYNNLKIEKNDFEVISFPIIVNDHNLNFMSHSMTDTINLDAE